MDVLRAAVAERCDGAPRIRKAYGMLAWAGRVVSESRAEWSGRLRPAETVSQRFRGCGTAGWCRRGSPFYNRFQALTTFAATRYLSANLAAQTRYGNPMMTASHTQCALSNGDRRIVTWLPSEFANVGGVVKLRARGEEWDDDWRVTGAYHTVPSEFIIARERDHLNHRKVTDI